MQHTSVKKLFKEHLRRYSDKDQYKNSPLTRLILEWLKNRKPNKKIEICEFGGGAGQLLGEIRRLYPTYGYTNVEIINDYKPFLVSKEINFVLGSVLDSNLRSKAFDVVVMRDVLHHLVGRSYAETRDNQQLALRQLQRLTKPGGAIFIEEFTNGSLFATRMIYYLTLLNTKIGIHIPSLFVSKNVIVAFLTPHKLLTMCRETFGKRNIKKQKLNVIAPWYIHVLHLFGRLKKIILTIQT